LTLRVLAPLPLHINGGADLRRRSSPDVNGSSTHDGMRPQVRTAAAETSRSPVSPALGGTETKATEARGVKDSEQGQLDRGGRLPLGYERPAAQYCVFTTHTHAAAGLNK